jgi:hypothetical protein
VGRRGVDHWMNTCDHPLMHPFLEAPRDAALQWHLTADDRLSPQPHPGILELRVSRLQLDRALTLSQAAIDGCLERGLDVAAVDRGRNHRAGVGVGEPGKYCAIRVVELRERIPIDEQGIERWLAEASRRISDEWILRERGYQVRAGGRLRVRLARRYDPSPRAPAGWRWSFTDQVGRPLEDQLDDIVDTLYERSIANRRRSSAG